MLYLRLVVSIGEICDFSNKENLKHNRNSDWDKKSNKVFKGMVTKEHCSIGWF